MSVIEAILLGLLQGLTEFLPISSSGHLELGKAVLGVEQGEEFTVVVHLATVCSVIVVFWKDIIGIFAGTFGPLLSGKPKWNAETKLSVFIIVSMLPVVAVYFIWGDRIDQLFEGHLLLVGITLLCTALILMSTTLVKPSTRPLNAWRALVIGVAQAVAVLPGISRSGSTISAGLLLGIDKAQVTRFAFLMVLLPIIGAVAVDIKDIEGELLSKELALPLLAGFAAAFVSGLLACTWMLNIVRKGKIAWFAIYCAIIGAAAIVYTLA